MEKYAVDLDKVLDEFEFNEDREERLANAPGKKSRMPCILDPRIIPPARHYRRPAFEPIDLADADFAAAPSTFDTHNISDSKTPSESSRVSKSNNFVASNNSPESTYSDKGSNQVIENSTSNGINGVFSSLSDYINSGTFETKAENGVVSDIFEIKTENKINCEIFGTIPEGGVNSVTFETKTENELLVDIADNENGPSTSEETLNLSKDELCSCDDVSKLKTEFDKADVIHTSDELAVPNKPTANVVLNSVIENVTVMTDVTTNEENSRKISFDIHKSDDETVSIYLSGASESDKTETFDKIENSDALKDVDPIPTSDNKIHISQEPKVDIIVDPKDYIKNTLLNSVENSCVVSDVIPSVGFNDIKDFSDTDLQQYLEELEAEANSSLSVVIANPAEISEQILTHNTATQEHVFEVNEEDRIVSHELDDTNLSSHKSDTDVNTECNTEAPSSNMVENIVSEAHGVSKTTEDISAVYDQDIADRCFLNPPVVRDVISIECRQVVQNHKDEQNCQSQLDINMNNTTAASDCAEERGDISIGESKMLHIGNVANIMSITNTPQLKVPNATVTEEIAINAEGAMQDLETKSFNNIEQDIKKTEEESSEDNGECKVVKQVESMSHLSGENTNHNLEKEEEQENSNKNSQLECSGSGDDNNNRTSSQILNVNNNDTTPSQVQEATNTQKPKSNKNSVIRPCLVRTPKDGNVINVMGEEEKPCRPKFLALSTQDEPPEYDDPTLGSPSEVSEHDVDLLKDGEDNMLPSSPDLSESSIEQAVSPVPAPTTPDALSPEDRNLGKVQPFWVPDSDAPNCMLCDFKFTVLKRRHHCRACGKVLCSKCCSLKARLEYMDNAEARVCQPCFTVLATIVSVDQGESATGSPSIQRTQTGSAIRRPNPNNPMEYCSTIPPLEQAASSLNQPPPSVLVPVGVLKREGSTKSRTDVAKQVMFSDGIRPGGDLTELDGSCEPRFPYKRPGRVLKRVGTPPGPVPSIPAVAPSPKTAPPLDSKTLTYIPPDKGLPPVVMETSGEPSWDVTLPESALSVTHLSSEEEPPVMFAINKNFFIKVKILNLDCCVNRICWCFTSVGLSSVGQDEVVLILECLPDEKDIPRDVFLYFNALYHEASRGNTVVECGYTPVTAGSFLDSTDHGGFLYVRPTFQCLHKLILPPAPYIVAILVHRWEAPWARVFPIRLILRLGAEFRYYPCMLVSIRHRTPVYCEIGHTIMNLLNDFRNLSYVIPCIRGVVIHMEDRQTSLLIPRNRYEQIIEALNNSNDPVLALAGNFSVAADSHLVCMQGEEDETYRTQAINIHNKPRKVTGASFIVFNGALKSTANLTAKSSIVEDGLMIQILPETMQALRTAIRNMKDFSIGCGPAGAVTPDETVLVKWVADDKSFNFGVKSQVDGRTLEGIPSIRVHNGTDYVGGSHFLRWTEVFILQCEDEPRRNGDPINVSRLSDSIARATCIALVKYLELLAQAGLLKIAVRATIHPENVGYEAGSNGVKLPGMYMDSLDNELVAVLHDAASTVRDGPAVLLELVFHVMLQ